MADDKEEPQTEEQESLDLDAGFSDTKGATESKGRRKEPEEEPKPEAEPEPEYVQLTKAQVKRLEEAAEKALSLELMMQKSFGTFGVTIDGIKKMVSDLQAATPRGMKVEIPKEMEESYPELAKHVRSALEASLRGVTGTAPANTEPDSEGLEKLVDGLFEKRRFRAELADLEDDFPDWQTIVGRVDVASGQTPDPNNGFRKWLASKDVAYQQRINETDRPADIAKALRTFQQETRPAPKPAQASLQQQLRQARIADAIKPRGDGGAAPPARTDEDEFAAGFASG